METPSPRDDFGTGYSSLSYLRRFPFDKIKIGRCFVNGLETEEAASVIRAIVNVAQTFGMSTTAEGVETDMQRDLLRKLGCDHTQGFLYARPETADQIAQRFGLVADVAHEPAKLKRLLP